MKRFMSLMLTIMLVTSMLGAVVVSAAEFSDIDAGHWAYASVKDLVAAQTINGYSDGTFRPDGTVTRAEFVKMLGKSAILREGAFADVDANHWAYDYIMYSGLEGDDSNNFRPDEAILRGDVANLLYKRFANGEAATAPYVISSQGKNKTATAWVYNAGLMVGDDMINLRLEDTITRAEAAVLIVRAKNLDVSVRKNFIDNFSDATYKGVYEGSALFDTAYEADANITNGEMALAALRMRFKCKSVPLGYYTYEKKFDGAYAAEWDIMCKNALPDGKYTSSEAESKANATVADAVAMLTHAAVNDQYTGIELNLNSADDAANNEKMMNAAKALGASLYANEGIDTSRAITKKELACLLMQYDLVFGANVARRCGYETMFLPTPIRTDAASYPSNAADYSVILADVPNVVYETPFAGEVTQKCAEITAFATDLASVYITPFSTAAGVAYNNGTDIGFTYIPSLIAKVKGGYTYRILVDVVDAADGAMLSGIFKLGAGVEDVALTDGATFWIDVATNSELAGLYIDYSLMTVEKVIR